MATKASATQPGAPWAAQATETAAATTPAAESPQPAVPPAAAPQPVQTPEPETAAKETDPVQQAEQAADAVVTDAKAEVAQAESAAETVIVSVPKAFNLRLDNDVIRPIAAGVQRLEKSVAEHWYAVANGVKKFVEDVESKL